MTNLISLIYTIKKNVLKSGQKITISNINVYSTKKNKVNLSLTNYFVFFRYIQYWCMRFNELKPLFKRNYLKYICCNNFV